MDTHVRSGHVVGLGTGPMVGAAATCIDGCACDHTMPFAFPLHVFRAEAVCVMPMVALETSGGRKGVAMLQVNHAIQYLSRRLDDGSMMGVRCLAASDAAASEAAFHGVPLTSADSHQEVKACHFG